MNKKDDERLAFLRDRLDIEDKKIYNLNIPDIYQRGNPKLVKLLKIKLSKYLK